MELPCCRLRIRRLERGHRMKNFILVLVIVFIGLGYSHTLAGAREKAKITIKMATLQPKGSALMKITAKSAEKIRKETNNEVAFKFYWGGVQGDESDVLRKMRAGQLHGGAGGTWSARRALLKPTKP